MEDIIRSPQWVHKKHAPFRDLPIPPRPTGHVVFTAFQRYGFGGRAKVNEKVFLPEFCKVLAGHGLRSHFVHNLHGLQQLADLPNLCIVHIYNEERAVPEHAIIAEAEAGAVCVFNRFAHGRIIGHKVETNRLFTAHGIPMPSMDLAGNETVFSNEAAGTSQPTALVASVKEADPGRYNTRYIDTRVAFEGREYFTSVRLMAVADRIVHAFVGARHTTRGRPSVHGVNTPLRADLVDYLHETVYLPHADAFADLVRRINDLVGPGFFHHDVLVERSTGDIYLCETGYKFDLSAYAKRMAPLGNAMQSNAALYDGRYTQRSVDAFLSGWHRPQAAIRRVA